MSRKPLIVTVCVAVLLAAAMAIVYVSGRRRLPAATATGTLRSGALHYVGTEACRACHAREYQAWQASHHRLSMQEASDTTVLGDFRDARFVYFGVTSRFYRRDGRFFVNTDGPDGQLRDYEISYTFGVHPLQQYLVAFGDGRLQALSIAWDSRPRELGGQKWFHLYPGERIRAGDELHWTKLQQNWNYMCAECHSTDLRKNYDAASDTFRSAWRDLDVGCEACHGAGSGHVRWAQAQRTPDRRGPAGRTGCWRTLMTFGACRGYSIPRPVIHSARVRAPTPPSSRRADAATRAARKSRKPGPPVIHCWTLTV